MSGSGDNYIYSDEVDDEIYYVTVQEWEAFIRQLDLRSIWLKSSQINRFYGAVAPIKVSLEIEDDAAWENEEDGFQVVHSFTVELFGYQLGRLASIKVAFGLRYSSETAMNLSLWEYFEANILHVHSWPYFREYVSSTVARMNWLPLTIPAYKIYQRNKKTTEEVSKSTPHAEKSGYTGDEVSDMDDLPF